MNAEIIAKALGGRRAGGSWIARCPAHEDRKPSLSISEAEDGKVLVHCHAGCEQARVIAALRSRGLWIGSSPRGSLAPRHLLWRPSTGRDEAQRTEAALAIWRAAPPAMERWSRPISLARPHLPPPPTLRFHAGLKHPRAAAGRR